MPLTVPQDYVHQSSRPIGEIMAARYLGPLTYNRAYSGSLIFVASTIPVIRIFLSPRSLLASGRSLLLKALRFSQRYHFL